jgi:hypothetical protein
VKHRLLPWIVVTVLTIGGLLLRAERLRGPEGSLGEDEARLVLAAAGVMAHGVPVMPSGRVYLRGLVNTYLTAGSMAVLGRNDAAARVPNVLFGTLLIPLVFLFGRRLSGTSAGISAAVFVTLEPRLIEYSANAWMTSLFVVAFVAALYLLFRGFVLDQARMQVAGALATVIAVLTHELGVLLVPTILTLLAIRWVRDDRLWYQGRRSQAALVMLLLSVALFVGLGLLLRTGTPAGAAGEFRHYVGPSLSPDRLLLALDRWRAEYLPLLVAMGLGLPLALRRGKTGGLLLYLALGFAGATLWVVIDIATGQKSVRYTLMLLPLLALCAAWTITEVSAFAAGRLRLQGRGAGALTAGILAVAFGLSLRSSAEHAARRAVPATDTWLTEFRRLAPSPDDLILTDNVEAPSWYLGRADFWERGGNYERYTYLDQGRLRNLYTGSLRVATPADVSELARANPGKTLWYLGNDDGMEEFPPDLRSQVLSAAQARHRTADSLLILRIDLSLLDAILRDTLKVSAPRSR